MAQYETRPYAGRDHFYCTLCPFDSSSKATIEARVCDQCPEPLQEAVEPGAEAPARNASRDVWAAYAAEHGVDPTDQSRDQIRSHFTKETNS